MEIRTLEELQSAVEPGAQFVGRAFGRVALDALVYNTPLDARDGLGFYFTSPKHEIVRVFPSELMAIANGFVSAFGDRFSIFFTANCDRNLLIDGKSVLFARCE